MALNRFIPFANDHRQFTADELAGAWRQRWEREQAYAPIARKLLHEHASCAGETAPGLLPYASKRKALHAWPELYELLLAGMREQSSP
jgi:hypothetical protein